MQAPRRVLVHDDTSGRGRRTAGHGPPYRLLCRHAAGPSKAGWVFDTRA